MNKTESLGRIGILLCCLCLLFQGAAWSKTQPVAAVIAGSGSLQVRRAGAATAMPLALRSPLFAGDVISTGPTGSAKVLFNDGSQVKMRANTRLQITAPSAPQAGTNLFVALTGEIWARLRPGRGVKTVYTNLVVRGTEFDLLVADDTATVTVVEGAVDFSNRFGAVTVEVAQQSTARPDAAPTKPVTIANPGLIIEWTLDIENVAFPLDKSFGMTRDAAFVAADALFDSGKYEAALASYQQGGDAPAARLRSGYALLKLGRLDEAEAVFRGLTALPEHPATAYTGLAWTELKHNRFEAAHAAAFLALEAPGGANLVEPHLVLGVALLRQNKAAEAEEQLRAALEANPPEQRYQARAWLALLHLARSHNDEALKEARLAVQAAPNSSLAQVSLATVGFFAGETAEASRAAKRAATLSPEDMAVQVALGQAKLAEGDVDGAARAAARATALDPQWPQAHYLLGVADAGRRDWSHAERSLKKTLEIAPDFFPATAALARVYVRMGREKQGLALLDDYEKAHGENNMTLTARGEVFYTLARYDDAMQAYRKAVQLSPGSAVAWNGLARVALEGNHLTEAIHAGQQAVRLEPDVGEFHAVLGLAYEFSRLDSQAEHAYRTALTLDPNNALALVKLGFQNKEGDARTEQRSAGLTFAQGFLLDPAASKNLLRGGIYNQIELSGGTDNTGLELVHRTLGDDGKLNFYGRYVRNKDDNDRPNADLKVSSLRQDTTYSPSTRTNVYFHAQQSRHDGGLPGIETNPFTDDRNQFRVNEGILAVRQQVGRRQHLWAGAFINGQRDQVLNPDQDRSAVFPFTNITVNATSQTSRSRAFSPELRMDVDLGPEASGDGMLSLGVAQIKTKLKTDVDLLIPGFGPFPATPGNYAQKTDFSKTLAYAQLMKRLNPRLSIIGQLRQERIARNSSSVGGTNDGFLDFSSPLTTDTKSHFLPSFTANYQVNAKTALRFLANRRVTDVTSSIFAPTNTLLTTEKDALPLGLPDPGRNGDLRSFEIDAEHYLAPNRLLKIFLFQTTGRHLIYDFSGFAAVSDVPNSGTPLFNSLQLDSVKRTGIGARYEHQLSKSLFSQAKLSFNRTTNLTNLTFTDFTNGGVVTAPASYSGGIAPYHPKITASWNLNYITPRGVKAGLNLRYAGSMFQDTGDPLAATRPRFPAKLRLDLFLAREASVHTEIFVQVLNVFDSRQVVFNGIPIESRRVSLGVTRRF